MMRSMFWSGLIVAAALVHPAAAERLPDRALVSPRLLRGVTPTVLLRGLDEADFELTRANLNRYRIVQAEQVFTREAVLSLRAMVDGDSLARRNRDLFTDVLRQAEAIGDDERVSGIALAPRLIFVTREVPAAHPRGGKSAALAERVVQADAMVLARDLSELNFEATEANLYRYRVVPGENVLSPGKRRLLADAIDKDSSARRNRDLLTASLRRSGTVTEVQHVIGVSAAKRIIYVLGDYAGNRRPLSGTTAGSGRARR